MAPERLLVRNFERIDADFIQKHPGVKVIGVPQTGTDNVDFDACEYYGVQVVSLTGERRFLRNITSTAEHTWGLIIALMRNYHRVFDRQERLMGNKLKGKTIGIVGHKGRIGRQVTGYAKAFGMKVMGYEKNRGNLLDLLRLSDIVTIHIPLKGNEGFWRLAHFKQMKPDAYFVNTSRTKVMADHALSEALKNGIIAGAALDFTDDQELIDYTKKNDNLILTPHIGGFTEEDRALTDAFILNKMNKCRLK